MLTFWLTGEDESLRLKRIQQQDPPSCVDSYHSRNNSQRHAIKACHYPENDIETPSPKYSDTLNRKIFTYGSDGNFPLGTPTFLKVPRRNSIMRSNSAKNIASMKHHGSVRNSCLRGKNDAARRHFTSTMNGVLSDRRSLSGTNLMTNTAFCGNSGEANCVDDETERLLIGCSLSRQKLHGKSYIHERTSSFCT